MKRVLITGITGMIGTHLSDLLMKNGCTVSGISRFTSDARYKNYKHYLGDVLDKKFLRRVWSEFNPDVVYHLAAQAYNGLSWEYEDTTYEINIQGTRNVLDACVEHMCMFIPACSSAEYGYVVDQPIKEDTPLHPITPYGVSKACVENMTLQYYHNYGLISVIPRLFITIGPNHPPTTFIQNAAMQFAKCKLGIDNNIVLGNVYTERDFIDVEDCVRALWLLQERGRICEPYNICSGNSYPLLDIIDHLKEISGISPTMSVSKALHRLSDEKHLTGDNSKISQLGWSPQIEIRESLQRIYNNWIERLSE